MKIESTKEGILLHLDWIEVDALVKTLDYVLDQEEPLLLEEEWDDLVTLREGCKNANKKWQITSSFRFP